MVGIMHHVLILMGLVLGCAGPQVVEDPFDNAVPKYGDPTYKTIWSWTDPVDRQRNCEASIEAAELGWGYLEHGDPSTAMKRFNQAWSLCPANPRALWGMAVVQYQRSRSAADRGASRDRIECLDEAVSLIEEAAALPPPGAPLLHHCATMLTVRGLLRRELDVDGWTADFDRAEQRLRLAESIEVDPLLYDTWSKLESHRGHPDLAERFARKARLLRDDKRAGR